MTTDLTQLDIPSMLIGVKSENTVKSYTGHWAAYLEFAGSHDATDAETLVRFRQHLIIKTKESANTINLRLNAVKSIFRELGQRKIVAKEVVWGMGDVKGLKANALLDRRNPNARTRIAPTEMRGITSTPQVNLMDPVAARDRALLLLMATSGMRVSEVVAVKVKDLQRMDEFYFVANIMGKNQGEVRVAPCSAEAHAAIQDWLFMRPTTSEYVFTKLTWTNEGEILYTTDHMSADSAYKTVKRIGREYGKPEISPHAFRRFVGTQLAKKDIREAQRVLGHKDIGTTAKHYVQDDVPLGTTENLF